MRNKIIPSLSTCAKEWVLFIGPGILAKALAPTWINDPTTKSGIAIAGLLNATTLEIAKYLTKTGENTTPRFKALLSVVSISITAITTPLLATALTDRFAVVLTSNIAIQSGLFYLSAKATLYFFSSFLGTRSAPVLLTTQQLSSLTLDKLIEYYENFRKSETFSSKPSLEIQNAFIKAFSNVDRNELAKLDLHQLSSLYQFFQQNNKIWYEIGFASQIALNNCFLKNGKDKWIPLTRSPEVQYITKECIIADLARLLHASILDSEQSYNGFMRYSPEIREAYNRVFIAYHLSPLHPAYLGG